MHCESCKHYEFYHKHPNPNAVTPHYCKKCEEPIRYIKWSGGHKVWLPKRCYFNNHYEESEKSKRERENQYETGFLAYQIED